VTIGALLAYYVFGIYGERALERFGHVIHVEGKDTERGQRWFRRWGENSVFWGRMSPLVWLAWIWREKIYVQLYDSRLSMLEQDGCSVPLILLIG
jgi:membrane protein DedA with SNARE-associated domain